jgi:hypothetical protein
MRVRDQRQREIVFDFKFDVLLQTDEGAKRRPANNCGDNPRDEGS